MTDVEEDVESDVHIDDIKKIVVYNDDVNSFDHVIITFEQVLGHHYQQAEQLAHIIHHNGRASVKEGEYLDLLPLKEALCEHKLHAKIE